MKNKNKTNGDHWETPKDLYIKLNNEFNFDFDPCPLNHDIKLWDGLEAKWGTSNFVNPPYSRKLKDLFVKKSIEEAKRGATCVVLIPVSTSTILFHDHILPNHKEIRYIKKRLRFSGYNNEGLYIEGVDAMQDHMIVIFGT